MYRLVGADGSVVHSPVPGRYGGHRRLRIYGRLDCPSAARWLACGHYARYRVFFADASTAQAAGYRPCAVCLPEDYARWRAEPGTGSGRVAEDDAEHMAVAAVDRADPVTPA